MKTASAQNLIELFRQAKWKQIGKLVRDEIIDPRRQLYDARFRCKYWPLHMAIEGEFTGAQDGQATQTALAMIAKGAPLESYSNGTPLMLASKFRNHDVLEALIVAGAQLNVKAPKWEDGGGETALIYAAQKGDLWSINRLIRAGANVNAQSLRRESALFFAAQQGHLEVVRALFEAGCQLHGNEFHWPVAARNLRMVTCLIKLGADVDGLFTTNSAREGFVKGDTPLIVAVRRLTRELFKIDGDLTPRNDRVSALLRRRLKITQALLAAGAEPNLANAKGLAPLSYATWQNEPSYIKMLVAAGANPKLASRAGKKRPRKT